MKQSSIDTIQIYASVDKSNIIGVETINNGSLNFKKQVQFAKKKQRKFIQNIVKPEIEKDTSLVSLASA